jgi:alpha-galactosidase
MPFRRQIAWRLAALIFVLCHCWLATWSSGQAAEPLVAAMGAAARWTAANFGSSAEIAPGRRPYTTQPPFSFTYDGKSSGDLAWQPTRASRKLDDQRTEHALTYADDRTELQVRCVAVEYHDFPMVEWTAYFKNAGTSDSPMLEDIQGLDVRFERGADGEFMLHGIKGDFCTPVSFEPYQRTLAANTVTKFAPPGSGKSSDGPEGWPYFNLQFPGGGVILAVGWPGQWASSFTRDAAAGLRIRAGQQLTRLRLKPGEEIRTPLMALLFWRGTDVVAAQNLWRRWYVAHNLPRVGGKPQPAVAQIQVGGAEKDIAYVQRFLDAGIHVDLCWRDAGGFRENVWFQTGDGPFKERGMIWLNSGTWEIDPAKYPSGFKPFTDWIHARGMQFVLWFEPERVGDPNSWLGKNHPDWLLPGTSHGALLDEGHPEARKWLTDHVSGMIQSQGIDWYREDMNGAGPLPAWRRHDAPDRQGMTENLYVQGHLAFWDELRRRHPALRIDSCASGGRRNDLETMRRAVPLLRSDFQFPNMPGVVEGNQGHTYGLSFWLPFQGTGCYLYEPYAYRSFYLPSFGMGALTAENTAAQRKAYAECRQVAPLMLADYLPLTPYSPANDRWIAWQFHRPEQGDGVVQAFRRPQSQEAVARYKLRGLDPGAGYVVTNLDSGEPQTRTGRELQDDGLAVSITDQPGSALIVYKKAT